MSKDPAKRSYLVLTGIQAKAQAEAERHFGDGPVATWHPPSASTESSPRRVWWPAALGCVALATGVAWIAWQGSADSAPTQKAPPVPTETADDTAAVLRLLVQPMRPDLPERATSPMAAAPSLRITRKATQWDIEAVGVTRLAAAQRLAQASGSSMVGDLAPLAATGLLNVKWHGRDIAGAWQTILGSGVSFAMQCSSARCHVWVVETGASAQGPVPSTPPQVLAQAATIDTVHATSQSDSADARVSAHHD